MWLAALLACKDSGDSAETDVVGQDLVADTTPIVADSEACDACGGDCLDEVLAYEVRYHHPGGIDYTVTPPAGGPHDPCWTDFGVHTEPVEDEHWVHNLEHGAVVILWNCPEGCSADQAAIEAQVPVLGPFAMSVPYSEMESRFAVISWQHRRTLGCYDADAIAAFYTEHVDQGPESTSSMPPSGCVDTDSQ